MRIIQAENETKDKKSLGNNESQKTGARSQSLTPQQQQYQQQQFSNASSDDGSVTVEDSRDCSSPEKRRKNRGGYCFGTALFEVGDLLGSRNYTKVKRLKKGGWYVLQLL